jgi:EmrB/QacA subfamily drug resistance transporter
LPRYGLTALIVACAVFMETLDGTVIATSLPAIAADLHQDPITLKLALTSYLLSLAIFIPASGWAADRFGARTVFRIAIVVFTLGSILCGLSSNLSEFVGARMIQGMGGAMMVPVGRLVLLRSVERSEVVGALAYLMIPSLLGPIAGPPIGGFITTYFHWRWIFFVNVPIGIVGIVLVSLFIKNVRGGAPRPLDLPGFLILGSGLASLVFGVTVIGRGLVGTTIVVALIAAGILLLIIYVLHARRAKFPILELRLLKISTFRASLTGGSVFRIGVGALPLLLPLMLQLGFGMNPFQSGTITFVSSAGAMLMKATAPPILRFFGFRRVLIFDALLSSAFFASYGLFTISTPILVMMSVLLVGGFIRSLEFTSLNAIAYADIEDQAMSQATSFAAVAQQLSLSFGIAVGAIVIELAREFRGDSVLTTSDFHWGFLIIALISASSVLSYLRLPHDAGTTLVGRRRNVVKKQASEEIA